MNEPVSFVSGTVGKECPGNKLLEMPPYMPGESHTHTRTYTYTHTHTHYCFIQILKVLDSSIVPLSSRTADARHGLTSLFVSTSFGKSTSGIKPQDGVHEQRADPRRREENATLRRAQSVRMVTRQAHFRVSAVAPKRIACLKKQEVCRSV